MRILFTAVCIFIMLQSFSQNDSTFHTLKVRLIKAEQGTPHCGLMAWALAQKFEILESDSYYMKPDSRIILINACPEFLGQGYFVTNRIYNVKVSHNSHAASLYNVINRYSKEYLPIFWIEEIKIFTN
jgi:hypothetical protein